MPPAKIETALASHVGRVRTNNEDAVAVDEAIGLLVLADGMGGHQAGEIASGMAVTATLEVVRRQGLSPQAGIDPSTGANEDAPLLRQALLAAHAAIYQAAREHPECAGMGTTAVIGLLRTDRLTIAYAGDSRAYLWRAGHLRQITRDHSLLEQLVARGVYSRSEANKHVQKNIITRALGIKQAIEVDIVEESIQPGDIVLLCSDGLTDLVEDAAITTIISESAASLDQAAQMLVEQANARGGRDNVSVVLARVEAVTEPGLD